MYGLETTARSCRAVDSQFRQLAIERRPTDPQPPRDFGHAPAIMADGQADYIGLDVGELAHMAVPFEQGVVTLSHATCGRPL